MTHGVAEGVPVVNRAVGVRQTIINNNKPLLYTLGLCHHMLSHTNRKMNSCDLKDILVEIIQRLSLFCLLAVGAGSHYVCYHLALLLPTMLYCSVVTNTPRTIARDDKG